MNKINFDRPTAGERFRYWFDGVMSKGMIALIGLLAFGSVVLIAVMSLVITVLGLWPDEQKSFDETFWSSLMHALDSGTLGGDDGVGLRAAQLVVTVAGIIVVASLISIISNAFDARVEQLRKGHSRVLEQDHTLILGWNSKIFAIVNEICLANQSRRSSAIVVLAPGDKIEMEEALQAKVPDPGRTRLIVRSGDPLDLGDLEVASPRAARSIVILAPDGDEDPDSAVIKAALALTNSPHRKQGRYHIVGEIRHSANMDAARLVGRDEADWVLTDELISRITVQTSRQSGLSEVYTELLDFAGDELYFSEQTALTGRTYLDAQQAFADSAVIGVLSAGGVVLNPPAARVMQPGEKLILIAEDDSKIRTTPSGRPDMSLISDLVHHADAPDRALVLGCNNSLGSMLAELDRYVAAGSTVTVVSPAAIPDLGPYKNLSVTHVPGDTVNRSVLESLRVHEFDHIVVLSDKDDTSPQRADAKTLITLLHLREMANGLGVELNVVSEMLDDRNRELAEVTKADDFIVSDKLISLMLSQTSENERTNEVFQTLFSSTGSEIYLRPADLYIKPGAITDFHTVVEAASRRGETAIGYRITADKRNKERSYGITLNPTKRDQLTLVPGDKVIVLAES
ncbi:NAD-binding protein [Actinoplanes sp. TRM 88003]|uniref:NAD-binding protein n=1 Tax=Paractinoplanes aksuensis TaxID=2939490 RepID=A0ABT1E4D2_9ACTN|nr:NAD-binding protein [Actinoplanes aksuensis]MCO8277997.1 NAD-binding protein [Actinoplanes aksuensis]